MNFFVSFVIPFSSFFCFDFLIAKLADGFGGPGGGGLGVMGLAVREWYGYRSVGVSNTATGM